MMASEFDVVIVGSGPNGLAAAVIFAAAGLSVHVVESQPQPGGGCRTVELDLGAPLRHDLCSAVHPMAAASPFFEMFDLASRVELAHPEVAYAHPLDDGPAVMAYRDFEKTVDELCADDPADGRLFRRIMAPLVDGVEAVRGIGLSDMRSIPSAALSPTGLLAAADMAARALELGTTLWDRLAGAKRCGALLTGVAAHANTVIPSVAGAGTALLLGTLAHTHGWPIPVGGSQSITDALIADLSTRGVEVTCGCHIGRGSQLPTARVYVFDTSPWTVAEVFADRLSARYRRALNRFKPGNGVAKVDFALSEPVPWADAGVARAGTVHLGGDRSEMEQVEKQTTAGRVSDRPMLLVSQPTVVDQSRLGKNGECPLWTYAHVPNGSTRDMTDAVSAQIERFAPGFRDVVIGSRCIPANELSHHNANYVGGDIGVGHVSMYRMVARPMLKWDPYRTALGDVYLCSGSTPPGPGVHGMSGLHAAKRVLNQHFGISSIPDLRKP
jgi:phytoene dehydrogenase-like protein